MNKKAGIVVIIAIVIVVAMGYAVSDKNGRGEGPIKIGFIGPLSGDAATYGEPISNAVKLAVSDINAAGGVSGEKVEVIYEDGECSGPEAASAAQKLINIDKVRMIVGGICSGELLAMAPITEKAEVIVISPSATSPDVTNAGDFIFRNVPSDSDGGKTLAKIIVAKSKKAAIISENTDFAQALKNVFAENFAALGGEIVASESYIQDTNDFRSILTKIKAANPEVLVVNPQTEIAGGIIIKQARELGITVPVYGNIIMAGSKAAEIAGTYAEGMIFVDAPGLNPDNQESVRFLQEYNTRYGKPTLEFYLGAAYDEVHILVQAVQNVGTDTQKIRDYLYGLEKYHGVIGTYGFDKNGDLSGIEFLVRKIQNGEVIEVQ